MTDQQFSALLSALNPSFLESVAYAATIVMALIAGYALYFARAQILAARSGTKATFLVDLDGRWEGTEMKEARARWREMRDAVTQHIEQTYPEASRNEKRAKRGEHCSKVLHTMVHKEPEKHITIMSIFGFFETTGYIVDNGFISAEEIVDLYGESILELDQFCWSYIEKRREEATNDTGVPTKLWEHARNLMLATRQAYRLR